MIKPLVAVTKALQRSKDKARLIAQELLDKIEIDHLIDDSEQVLIDAREALAVKLTPLVKSAWRTSKLNAIRTILDGPAKGSLITRTRLNALTRTMNKDERKLFEPQLNGWDVTLRAKNVAFGAKLIAWAERMQSAGMSRENIVEVLKRDWMKKTQSGGPGGRETGEWQRGYLDSAADLISLADLHGNLCGSYGIGEKI